MMNVKLDLSGFRIESLAVSVEEGARSLVRFDHGLDVYLEMRCKQRETGEMGRTISRHNIDEREWKMMTDEQRVDRIRYWLCDFLRHELDECLLVDGVRVFDPHKDEWTPKPADLPNLAGMTVDMTTLSLVDP